MIKTTAISTALILLLLAGTAAGAPSTPNPKADPVPDIRIDGHTGPLTVPHTQAVKITCSIDPGNQTGTLCRMWIVARLNGTGKFWLQSPGNWRHSPTPLCAHQGPLFGFNDFVLDRRCLPLGAWTFTFAVATAQGLWFDTLSISSIPLSTPAVVQGEFYIGCCMPHGAGEFAVPIDTDTLPYISGNAWFCGTNAPAGFIPDNLTQNQYPPAEFGWYWCIRAGY